MNILVVSSFLPYPLFSGGHIRLYSIIKELSRRHTITLICEKRKHQTEDDVKEVEKICEVIWVERKQQWSIKNILQAGFSSYPFLMTGHTNSEMKKRIEDVLRQRKIDVIHIETFYVYQNMPRVLIPTVLVEHNIEYLVYKRFADSAPKFIKHLLLLDILKMRYWEQKFWQKATKLVAVSEQEKNMMTRDDVAVVPNGVDVNKFKVRRSELKVNDREKRVLFIGDFRWIQNRDALEWILKEIWPEISSKFPTSPRLRGASEVQSSPASPSEASPKAGEAGRAKLLLWIVGRDIPSSLKKLTKDDNIMFDENASENTTEIFKKADILLAPIRIGGGTSFKILEAMASGVPVVTTSLGIEGIGAIKNKEVLIANTSYEFGEETNRVLRNPHLYKELAGNARKLIEEKYDWDVIVKKLEDVYTSVVYHAGAI